MDFRSLSRRELQALCKRNKIPANITNVAMADALAALPSVEGMEEFLNGEGCGVPESPMKEEFVYSEIHRTALRTSTRRKTVKDEPITTRTRRAAAARSTEELENRDLNVALTTPSLASGRRRAAAASSACKKVDFQMTVDVVEKEDDDLDQEKNVIDKTPALPKSQKRAVGASTRRRTKAQNNGATEQRVYSTRRSVKLLEKNMENLRLGKGEKMEPITVHMSFDEMSNRTGPVKEDTNLEIESKKTDKSESKLDDNLKLEIDNQGTNDLESEVKVSEVELEMDLDSLNCYAENLVTEKSCDVSETEAADNDLNVKCFPEVEKANEASKDDDAVEISAEEINDSDEFSLPTEDPDLTEVHNSSIVEESNKQSEQDESICESECVCEEDSVEESKLMNNSGELSLPHEEEEEIQVDDVLSSVQESVMEVKDDDLELEEEEKSLDADIEGDKKEMEMETVSVQAEVDDTVNSMEFPENVSEELVDVNIPWQMEETPKDINIDDTVNFNIDTIDSEPEIPKDIRCEEEALVEVSVTTTEQPTSSNINAVDQLALANQFPRPTVETKSPLKEQTIKLLIDNSDAEEDEDEKEQEKANCIQRQIVEKNDMSLRQLRKMFKEQLQLGKKKMNNNNTKVVGAGKVRTALQPLPENRMAMDELEKRF